MRGLMTMPECVGLVAGEGELPAIVVRAMLARDLEIVAIALSEPIYASCSHCSASSLLWCGPREQDHGGAEARRGAGLVFIGKVSKDVLFRRWRVDSRAWRVLRRAKSFQDDALLTEIIREFESEGIRVVEQTHSPRALSRGES